MNDIAEEVIRIWGYNDIRSTAFLAGVKTGEYTPRKAYSNRLARLLCALGCWETCTFSALLFYLSALSTTIRWAWLRTIPAAVR